MADLDQTNPGENLNNSNQTNISINKKNRTLQYYKFLFYSLKTEIKVHDFLKLLRNSNTAELSIWTISVVLYANIPKDVNIIRSKGEILVKYNGGFIWLHIVHIIRAFLGMFIGYKLPRSYQIMDSLQNLSDEKLEKTLFNDILRETLYNQVILVIKERKFIILTYFFSTILNIIFDAIDFFVTLSELTSAPSGLKVVFITYLFICIIYLVIDFSYFFFAGQLKYIFPSDYLRSITAVYYGSIERAMITFKLRKEKTNVIDESSAQKSNGPYIKSRSEMNNGGFNILEYIMKDSLGVYQYADDKYLPEFKDQIRNKEKYNDNNIEPKSDEILN